MTWDRDELEALLLEWESGTLDEPGTLRLREILKGDEAAREHFLRMQMLSAAMKTEGDSGLGGSLPLDAAMDDDGLTRVASPLQTTRDGGFERPLRVSNAYLWLAAIAATVACLLGGRLAYVELNRPTDSVGEIASAQSGRQRVNPTEATSTGIALVTRMVDVVWDPQQEPVHVGDALVPGRLALDSGFLQVEFFCGATVIIEGPAELDLDSAMLARVHSGKLRAQVPPAARGFSLDVADMKVVDLGTEFGLSVSPSGADVQVFDGEVELHRGEAEQTRLLSAGEAVSRNAKGDYEVAKISPTDFVDIATLEARELGQQTERYERWKSWSQELRRDPRLIAYYAFDQQGGWMRKLKSSVDPINDELDGAIVGARVVQGRWGQKNGLEFKQPGDRVRVQIPGQYDSLTFCSWVKVDSLDRWYNSLFLTDGYDRGEPHWQILDTGQLFFSVCVKNESGDGPEHQEVLSAPFWKPSMSGKWLHLATTHDVDQKVVTHYLNGEVLHRETISDLQLARITRFGRASIGNWSSPQRPDAHFAIRNLNGSIDEFAIFAAALSADEIQEIYENGKP